MSSLSRTIAAPEQVWNGVEVIATARGVTMSSASAWLLARALELIGPSQASDDGVDPGPDDPSPPVREGVLRLLFLGRWNKP